MTNLELLVKSFERKINSTKLELSQAMHRLRDDMSIALKKLERDGTVEMYGEAQHGVGVNRLCQRLYSEQEALRELKDCIKQKE